MVFITIVIGAYKPTYNWGPHIVGSKTTSVVKPMINLPWLGMAITTHLQWFFFGMVDCWVYHFSTLIPLIVPLSHLFIKSIVLLIALYIYVCMVLKCIKYYLSRYFWYVYVCPYILLKKNTHEWFSNTSQSSHVMVVKPQYWRRIYQDYPKKLSQLISGWWLVKKKILFMFSNLKLELT